MGNVNDDKIVRYDRYCKTCKHWKLDQAEEPCNECLDTPTNYHSRKPVKYEPATTAKKKKEV